MRRGALLASLALLALVPAGTGRPAAQPTPSARVGAYYFDGWSGPLSNFHFEGLAWPGPNGQFLGRRPLSGWRDNSPEALQAQLRWAHADGIGFFVFDWFTDADPESGVLNTAHDNYLKLRDHDGVQYALMYVNQSPSVIRGDWARVVETWVTQDFLSPDYVRIDGKPLLLIFDTTGFRQQVGGSSADVNRAIDTLQETARRHGLPGVFVVGGRDLSWGDVPCFPLCDATDGGPNGLVTEHWDALSVYGYALVVEPIKGARPYSDAVSGAKLAWGKIAQESPFPYVPSVMTGWDPRPPDEEFFGTTLEWFTRTPGEVEGFLRDAIDWVGANPRMRVEPAPAPPVVLIEAWNELGEGATVLPTDESGYSYGQAIAQAVGIPWTPPPKHTLRVIPSAHGTVTSTPAGIACPPACTSQFDEGLQVTLTAHATSAFRADGWRGCTDTDPTCGVVLVRDSTVRTVFLTAGQRRTLSLRLTGHLLAEGRLIVRDGFGGCASYQQVQIQRRRGSGWTAVASTQTDYVGRYWVTLRDRPGAYRALARRTSSQGHTCLAAMSTPARAS